MRLDKVDLNAKTLHVSGVDVVDGTFIIDVKPYHPLDGGPLIRQDDGILVGGAAAGENSSSKSKAGHEGEGAMEVEEDEKRSNKRRKLESQARLD